MAPPVTPKGRGGGRIHNLMIILKILRICILTTALLEARTTAVPKTVPFRYSLVLTPDIKALIARKNTLRRIAQRTKNSGDKRNYEAQ
jgi:hypothetical protein